MPTPKHDETLNALKSKLSRYLAPHHDEPFQLDAALDLLANAEREFGQDEVIVELCMHGLEMGAAAMAAMGGRGTHGSSEASHGQRA